MKKQLSFCFKALVLILISVFLGMCSHEEILPSETNNDQITESNSDPNLKKGNGSERGGIIDDFNDGVISDIWFVSETNNAIVTESDGMLNIFIGEGPRQDGGNQVAGISSHEYFLTGDFDIQVDFQLCTDYHLVEEANSKFIVVDEDGDLIEISIRNDHYLTLELPSVGAPNNHGFILTDHLTGKLRISRFGNIVTTYYWENGWQQFGQWEPEYVAGNVKIDIDSWNWPPYFSAFSTHFDNLMISDGYITICHKPGTPAEKTLTIPVQALSGHLGHGDRIGACQ